MELVMETHNYIVLQANRGVGNIPIVLGLSLYFYKLNHEHVFYKSTLIPITETKESELVSKNTFGQAHLNLMAVKTLNPGPSNHPTTLLERMVAAPVFRSRPHSRH